MRSLNLRDQLLITKLATALAEHAQEEVSSSHYERSLRLLSARGGPFSEEKPKKLDVASLIA
jgi:hypothetical protein